MTEPVHSSSPQIGATVLGRYRVVRALAQGGMGTVYLARNEGAAGFVKPVVIKRSLRVAGKLTDEMFAREARILSNLRHPGIVGIVDFADEDGDYVMVLDYVHGYTLGQWSRFVRKSGGRIDVELGVYAVTQMLEALHYAHTLRDSSGQPLGIVHRDVKPSNVLVDVQGLVKLADFGVARTNTETTDISTGGGRLKGTFAFMAPELFSGAMPSAATDVYSAALTLYQLLVGRNPFATNDAALTAARVMRHEPDRLDAVRDDVTRGLASAIARGMCKHPDGRYRSAEELTQALIASCPETDHAAERFRAAVARDFNDLRLAEILETDSLAAREEAWTRFGAGRGESERRLTLPLSPSELEDTELARELGRAPSVVDDGDTEADGGVHTAGTVVLANTPPRPERELEPVPATTAAAPRRRSLVPIAIAITVVGVAAAVVMATRDGAKRQPAVVMVRGDVSVDEGDAAPAPVIEGVSAVADAAAPAVVPPPTRPRGPASKPLSPAARLTAQFRRRERSIVACFDRHGPSTGALALRFRVDTAGAVTRAELLPASAANTPLGTCLLEVARSTQFGPQVEALTFRIPIEVSRR